MPFIEREITTTEKVPVTEEYLTAVKGFEYETSEFTDIGGISDPEWRAIARNTDAVVSEVGEYDSVLVVAARGRVIVHGDVKRGAVVMCAGGASSVTVFGNVEEDARILCAGGGATITIHGTLHPFARAIARGGASAVVLLGYKTSRRGADAIGGGAQVMVRD